MGHINNRGAHGDEAARAGGNQRGPSTAMTMQTEDITIFAPMRHVHMLYLDSRPGPDGLPVIDERVVMIREIDPDGLGFHGWCVRRWWENRYTPGASCRRRFHFERVKWAVVWDGQTITNGAGLVVVPSLASIRDLANWLAARGVAA